MCGCVLLEALICPCVRVGIVAIEGGGGTLEDESVGIVVMGGGTGAAADDDDATIVGRFRGMLADTGGGTDDDTEVNGA